MMTKDISRVIELKYRHSTALTVLNANGDGPSSVAVMKHIK